MSLKYEAMLAVQSIRPIRGRMPTKNTLDDYFRHIHAFLQWAKAEYGCRNIREAKPHLQDYADYLVASGYSPATVHTYLNACCRGCEVPLGSIRHPTRHAADFTRGREIDLEQLETMQKKSPRAVCLAFAAGIRKREYLALRTDDLIVDENGYPCIQVRKGKGGKYQDPDAIMEFLRPYKEAGMKTVNYCDTIGVADPEQVKKVIRASQKAYPDVHIQVHLHDTRGLGMVNAMAAIECGVTDVQTALAGLGGCPFAPGASGNLSTEDTVWMLNEAGYDTGINFSKILAAAKYQVGKIPGNYSGHHITIDKETPCCF